MGSLPYFLTHGAPQVRFERQSSAKTTKPTTVKRWSSFFPYFATSWEQSFNTIYKSTKDNNLREFGYKILGRILVTNKQLEKFKIRNDDPL